MAGSSNLRGVGAEFIAEGIPSSKPTSAYQLSPQVETNIAKRGGGNLGNPNGNKRENRLVSKWRSGRLRYMVWGEHGTVPPAIIYDGKRQ
jgi:hypothetical protein